MNRTNYEVPHCGAPYIPRAKSHVHFSFVMVLSNYPSSSEALYDVSEHPCFYSVRLLASRQTPKLEDHSWSAVHDCLFNIFTANLHIWRPTPLSATQGTRHVVVIGNHGWQIIYIGGHKWRASPNLCSVECMELLQRQRRTEHGKTIVMLRNTQSIHIVE